MHYYHISHYATHPTLSDWLQLCLVIAAFAAVLVALFQDKLRDRFRRSNITYSGKVSHMQDHEEIGSGYKLHILRILLKNTYYEAIDVEVSVIGIQEDVNKKTKWRENFLEVPLYWTHGAIYDSSGVIRSIQKNQTAYLDICSGPTDFKSLSLSTGVTGNPDFRDLNPGRTVITLALFQKSGQTLYMVFEIIWLKGKKPTLNFLKMEKTLEEVGFL